MARQSAISDEVLTGALSVYAGMVDRVVNDPERWLGLDEDPSAPVGSVPSRILDAVKDRAFGTVTPASDAWRQLSRERRVDWWVARVGLSAGLAAAAPRFAGALADRVPLQAALGASAAGLAVCAVAREHGVVDPREWVPLLARVLLDREVTVAPEAPATPPEEAEQVRTDGDEPSRLAALGRGAPSAVSTLAALAGAFLQLADLLDERPRGSFFARALGKLPVVGVAGGWLDERGGIRKAATETAELLG